MAALYLRACANAVLPHSHPRVWVTPLSTGDLHRLAHQTPMPLPQQSVSVSQNSGAVIVLHVPEPWPSSTTALTARIPPSTAGPPQYWPQKNLTFFADIDLSWYMIDVCRLHQCDLPGNWDTTPHWAGAFAATFKGKFFLTEASLRRLKGDCYTEMCRY